MIISTRHFSLERWIELVQFNSLLNWRQWFSKQENVHSDSNYQDEAVSILQLVSVSQRIISQLIYFVLLKFRFADRLDLFLMVIAVLIIVVETFFFVAGIVLFSRLSGTFAMESFANTCRQQQQQQNLANTSKDNITCPLGINLYSINFNRMQKSHIRNKEFRWRYFSILDCVKTII